MSLVVWGRSGIVLGVLVLAAACGGDGDTVAGSTTTVFGSPKPGEINVDTDVTAVTLTPPLPTNITTVPGSGTTIPPVPTTNGAIEASGTTYTIKAGDNLNSIAKAFDVSKDDLIGLNGIVDPNNILVGKKLKIPVQRIEPDDSTPSSVAGTTTTKPVVDSGLVYTVKSGDSLGKIATSLGVSRDAIIALNGIADPNRIVVGQVLKIPQGAGDAK